MVKEMEKFTETTVKHFIWKLFNETEISRNRFILLLMADVVVGDSHVCAWQTTFAKKKLWLPLCQQRPGN